jgi:hypothetical protein
LYVNELQVVAEVQDCDRTGDPPVQPVGDDVATVLVCVPFVHVPQPLYVNELQVDGVDDRPARKFAKSCTVVPAGGVNIPVIEVTQAEAVLPETVCPPDLSTTPFTVRPWHCVQVVVTWASVSVEDDVQDCDKTGDPPVQPAGDDVATVRVCVPFVHVPQPLYVNEEQVDP